MEHFKRENFTLRRPRVCLEHFEGGKKSHVNNVATVFVMTVHLRCYCRYNLSKSPETKSFQSPNHPLSPTGLDE